MQQQLVALEEKQSASESSGRASPPPLAAGTAGGRGAVLGTAAAETGRQRLAHEADQATAMEEAATDEAATEESAIEKAAMTFFLVEGGYEKRKGESVWRRMVAGCGGRDRGQPLTSIRPWPCTAADSDRVWGGDGLGIATRSRLNKRRS